MKQCLQVTPGPFSVLEQYKSDCWFKCKSDSKGLRTCLKQIIKYVKDRSLALHWHLRMQTRDADKAEEKQRTEGFFLGASIKNLLV